MSGKPVSVGSVGVDGTAEFGIHIRDGAFIIVCIALPRHSLKRQIFEISRAGIVVIAAIHRNTADALACVRPDEQRNILPAGIVRVGVDTDVLLRTVAVLDNTGQAEAGAALIDIRLGIDVL